MAEPERPTILFENTSGKNGESAEILRNLTVLYATRTGELALDREFGLDATMMDLPQKSAMALLAAELVRKTQKYEPRARVKRVEWEEGEFGALKPKVVIALV